MVDKVVSLKFPNITSVRYKSASTICAENNASTVVDQLKNHYNVIITRLKTNIYYNNMYNINMYNIDV